MTTTKKERKKEGRRREKGGEEKLLNWKELSNISELSCTCASSQPGAVWYLRQPETKGSQMCPLAVRGGVPTGGIKSLR